MKIFIDNNLPTSIFQSFYAQHNAAEPVGRSCVSGVNQLSDNYDQHYDTSSIRGANANCCEESLSAIRYIILWYQRDGFD